MNNKSVLDISSDGECRNVPVPRFTAELKAKWIAALRSGEYRQGKTALREGGKHCCLGVLCELTNPIDPEGGSWTTWGLRPFQERWQGAALFDFRLAEKLASMNDRGSSFAEIADHIEANIPAEE